MNLIEEIIEELSDSSKSLATPFLKTKILASRISNQELLEWTNNELRGYTAAETPTYRIGKPVVTCDVSDGYTVHQNTALPLSLIDKETAQEIVKHRFNDALETLEKMQKGSASGKLIKRMGEDFAAVLSKYVQDKGNAIWITNIVVTTSNTQVTEVLSKIRSLLLDFMLKLESDIPNLDELMKDKLIPKETLSEKVEHIYNQTIIHSNGDGNVITAGARNRVKAKVHISKNSVEQLQEALKAHNVSEEDINEVLQLVKEEQPVSTTVFGPKVNAWVTKLYGKFLDGSWQVATGAGGGILVEILKQFYGMP